MGKQSWAKVFSVAKKIELLLYSMNLYGYRVRIKIDMLLYYMYYFNLHILTGGCIADGETNFGQSLFGRYRIKYKAQVFCS